MSRPGSWFFLIDPFPRRLSNPRTPNSTYDNLYPGHHDHVLRGTDGP
jgi:hypothetical protein